MANNHVTHIITLAVAMPETKEELRSIFITKGKVPNERVVEMQRNVLKLLGYNADFAVSCLNRIPADFGQDREVMMKMQQFALCAELACRYLLRRVLLLFLLLLLANVLL